MNILSSGISTVSSGMTSTEIEVIQNGVLCILDGGMGVSALADEGGSILVSRGGILYIATVSSGGKATVLNSGFGQQITVGDGGLFIISSGGTAHRCEILSGGTQIVYADVMAVSTTVMNGGILEVSSGGYARTPVISNGGMVNVWSKSLADNAQVSGTLVANDGAAVNNASIFSGGRIDIRSNGYAYGAAVSSGGIVDVSSGGITNRTSVFAGGTMTVLGGGSAYNAAVSRGTLVVSQLALAENASVNSGGRMIISSGGTATNIRENGGFVNVEVGASASFASRTIASLALTDTSATIHSGTTAVDIAVNSGGALYVYSGGKLTGMQNFENGTVVSMYEGAILDFDISKQTSASAALVNDLSVIQGTPLYTLTVSSSQPDGIYTLAGGAIGFDSTITVQNTLGEFFGTLTAGDSLKIGDADCKLNLNDSVLTFVVQTVGPLPENLVGTKDRVSWNPAGENGYTVEYSTDNFDHGLSVATSANAVDMLELPAGTYQWRVKAGDGEDWAVGNEIVSDNDNVPKLLQSNADGNGDLFFAKASGIWENFFFAQHVGSVNDWNGTKEMLSASGKDRLANLFFGSDDSNVLCLTDDENGDGLFLDDEFTKLPEGITEQQARIARIDEIRAGAGDDFVDMTSQQFEYTGDGLTIRGGSGNDTIWANKGDNWLFGDAGNDRIVGASGDDVIVGGIGNDRMHGGGGNDVFTFCENWGVDNVEQLATGSVTLWFASGDKSNWDANTLTYMDGENSVKVSGVAAEKITLRFGDDGAAQFASLTNLGAFFDATSERIFEESGKSVLASL